MALAMLIFGVAFAAFCVWLTVRIVNQRERWAKRTLSVAVGLPLLYVASFGPACWWLSAPTDIDLGNALDTVSAPTAYGPIGTIASLASEHGWSRIFNLINWYATIGSKGRNVLCGVKYLTVFRAH